MCLDYLTHGPNPTEEGEGYKVFVVDKNTLLSPYLLANPKKWQNFQFTFHDQQWLVDENDYQIPMPLAATPFPPNADSLRE